MNAVLTLLPVPLAAAHPLVHLNAGLNALATLLLLTALWQAKRGRTAAHGRTMLAALAVSTAFLASYLAYHALAGSVRFTHGGAVRYVYYFILLTHVVLAVSVPPLALLAAWHGATAQGWRGRSKGAGASPPPARNALDGDSTAATAREKHLKIVRWAYPIWLYVSVTGVIVYLMLYHLWPSSEL